MFRDVLRYRIDAHKRWQFDLTLAMSADEASRLADWLDPVTSGKERSITLPASDDAISGLADDVRAAMGGSWRVFFKTRDSDSRILLAHPSKEEWVATLALQPSVMGAFLAGLRHGQAGRVEKLGRLNPVSNLHVAYEFI